MNDQINLYSEEQIRDAEAYLDELGGGGLSLDNRSGRSPRPETARLSMINGSGSHVVKDVLIDEFAKDRLAVIVPRYSEQLPMSWKEGGMQIMVKRRFADESLGIREAIAGQVTDAREAHREGDPQQTLVMIMQVDRRARFEPGERPDGDWASLPE